MALNLGSISGLCETLTSALTEVRVHIPAARNGDTAVAFAGFEWEDSVGRR